MLNQIIEQKHFIFVDHFSTWEESIITSCQPLVATKVINQTYAFQIIENIKQYGPYIIIAPYIALPHCQENASGVNQSAIAFMRVREPVIFDFHDRSKDAQIFFTLASIDHQTHLKNLTYLANILEDTFVINALRAAENISHLEKIAQQFSEI